MTAASCYPLCHLVWSVASSCLIPSSTLAKVSYQGGISPFPNPKSILACCRRVWAVILTRPAWARRWALVWSRSKRVVADEVCLNRRYDVGPACDSLNHRTRACYLPYGLMYNELCHAVGVHSLSVPPSAF